MDVQKTNNTIDKVRKLQRKLYLAAKVNKQRKFHALYRKLAEPTVSEQDLWIMRRIDEIHTAEPIGAIEQSPAFYSTRV